MARIELQVPDILNTLTREERDRLLRSGLRAAVRVRAQELAEQEQEAQVHIGVYRQKYGLELSEFEKTTLTRADDVQAHEDYNGWFFWTKVLERASAGLRSLRQLENLE